MLINIIAVFPLLLFDRPLALFDVTRTDMSVLIKRIVHFEFYTIYFHSILVQVLDIATSILHLPRKVVRLFRLRCNVELRSR